MSYFPLFLRLDGWPCAVIGPGDELEVRARELAAAGASVTVISPKLPKGLQPAVSAGAIRWIPRAFRPGDLRGFRLAIDVRPDRRLHPEAAREARAHGVLYRAVDHAAVSDFIAGAVLRRGPLIIAITTSGCAPALAVRLRDRLAGSLGEEYGILAEMLSRLRPEIERRVPEPETRRQLWYRLVDSEAVSYIREGRIEAAQHLLRMEIERAALSRNARGVGS